MSHVTNMNESCSTYEWVMRSSLMWQIAMRCVAGLVGMSHVRHMNESCHTYEWVMFYIWIMRSSLMWQIAMHCRTSCNASCQTYEWVMSRIWIVVSNIWMSHVIHMNESWNWVSCDKLEYVAELVGSSHVTQWSEPRHTSEWVMSQIGMSHVKHMNASWDKWESRDYEVATISRLLKMICVFCRI